MTNTTKAISFTEMAFKKSKLKQLLLNFISGEYIFKLMRFINDDLIL